MKKKPRKVNHLISQQTAVRQSKRALFLLPLLASCLPVTASATAPTLWETVSGGGWFWKSELIPLHILPVALAGAFLVEIGLFLLTTKPLHKGRACIVFLVGNLLSFLLSYGLIYMSSQATLLPQDIYIVNGAFLILTFFAECSLEYGLLNRDTNNKRRLLLTVILLNLLTTILLGWIERTLCYGLYV